MLDIQEEIFTKLIGLFGQDSQHDESKRYNDQQSYKMLSVKTSTDYQNVLVVDLFLENKTEI